MKNVYPVIFTLLNDDKDTVLIEIPDWEILTEGYGMADQSIAVEWIAMHGVSLIRHQDIFA